MRTVFHIARNELRQLFYSPLAWTVLIALYLIGILGYFSVEAHFMEYFTRGGYDLVWLEFLTSNFFIALFKSDLPRGVISVAYCVPIFLPLITMRVFAQEFRNGTDKLLFSSPVSTTQLVFGKFTGLLAFNFAIAGIFVIIFAVVGLNVDHADWMLLFSGVVAIYLSVMLVAAIGMFFSSVTTYPMVAALLTLCFGIFLGYASGLVNMLGRLLSGILSGNSVGFMIGYGYVADYLSIGQLSNVMNGIIHSREIIHFFNATAVFVILTMIRLKSRRERIPAGKRWLWYTALFAGFTMIAYISTNPRFIVLKDITREKRNSLHPNTEQMLKNMDSGPMEVVYYINLFDYAFMRFHPGNRNLTDRYWERYRVIKPDIHIRYVYYYDKRGGDAKTMRTSFAGKSEAEIAKVFLRGLPLSMFKTSAEMASELDLGFEQYRNVARVHYQGKSTFLRCFPFDKNLPGTPYMPEEVEVLPVLHRLTGAQPRLFFSIGHAEVDPHGEGARGVKQLLNDPPVKMSLINQGLDSDTITLEKRALSDTAKVLAICDPWLPLPDDFLVKFDEYLAEGQNMLLMVEPDKREFMAPLLARLGLQTRSGVLGNVNEYYTGEKVRAYIAHPALDFSKGLRQFVTNEVGYRNDSLYMSLKGAVALEQVSDHGFKTESFLILDTVEAFNRPSARVEADVEMKLKRQPDDEVAPFTVGYKLTREVNGKEQRILVVGDADIKSELFKGLSRDIFGWLSDSGFPVDLVKPDPLDKTFAFEPGTTRRRKAIWIYGVTGLMILIASVVLIRRNRN